MTCPCWSIARYRYTQLPSNLQVGLVHEPAIPGDVPAGPGCVDQLRGEPLHPPVDRDVIHQYAAFGQ